MKTGVRLVIIACLLVIALLVSLGCAQRAGQAQGAATAAPEGSQITVIGKIDYMKNLGGYFIMGEKPAREYIIMNDNPKVLEGLFKSGKIVTIEGRIVRGAEYLFIEKIDGTAYRGESNP